MTDQETIAELRAENERLKAKERAQAEWWQRDIMKEQEAYDENVKLRRVVADLEAERDALRKVAGELVAVLKPFAEYAVVLNENHHPDDMMVGYYFPPRLTVGHCRNAAAVLASAATLLEGKS